MARPAGIAPISLVTIWHTGAYSACAAFRAAGYHVVPPGKIHSDEKARIIARSPDADVVWSHWSWIEKCPEWVLDRHVVVMLRDPIECAISAHLRGMDGKNITAAEQWLKLWRHRDRVDQWVRFPQLDFSRYGLGPLPHENATKAHPAKDLYRARRWSHARRQIAPLWDCLMVIRREIREVFDTAGMRDLLARSPILEP